MTHLDKGLYQMGHPLDFSVRSIPMCILQMTGGNFWSLSSASYCTCYATVLLLENKLLSALRRSQKFGIAESLLNIFFFLPFHAHYHQQYFHVIFNCGLQKDNSTGYHTADSVWEHACAQC